MKLKAFTLAEVLTVVAILGIVAAITIPATLHHYDLEKSRSMIRKAATVYEQAVNNMSVERGLYSDGALKGYVGADCSGLSNYFKQIHVNAENNCYFQTPDGVWWYFGDSPSKPLISTLEIKPENLERRIKDATNPNDEETYYLIGRFDGTGALRINDLSWEKSVNFQNNVYLLSKLYAFTRKIENNSYYDTFLDEYPLYERGDFNKACENGKTARCTDGNIVYDSRGEVLATKNGDTWSFNRTHSDRNGTAIEEGCDESHGGCDTCKGNQSICNSRLNYASSFYYKVYARDNGGNLVYKEGTTEPLTRTIWQFSCKDRNDSRCVTVDCTKDSNAAGCSAYN